MVGKANEKEATEDCCLCLCAFEQSSDNVMELDCGHVYHATCIAQWFRRQPSCTLCRSREYKQQHESRMKHYEKQIADMQAEDASIRAHIKQQNEALHKWRHANTVCVPYNEYTHGCPLPWLGRSVAEEKGPQ